MLAYLTLFTWSFLAATIVPLGSEPAVLVMVHQGYSLAAIVAVATVGNYLGACTTYWIALRARHAFSPTPSPRLRHASTLIGKYGQPALLLSWVPLVGDAVVAAAGLAQVRFMPFSLWTFAGKLLRYVLVVWGARALWTGSL
jgi:membrane protein YqaA with SNARE-associated domain